MKTAPEESTQIRFHLGRPEYTLLKSNHTEVLAFNHYIQKVVVAFDEPVEVEEDIDQIEETEGEVDIVQEEETEKQRKEEEIHPDKSVL